jgi:branched-chain amino acid aminotransferase
MTALWCNGQWLDPLDFPASPMDRGITLGLGLFETILALDGRPVFLDRHLARLRLGCERLGWTSSFEEVPEIASELLVRNQLTTGRARIRLAITAGAGPLDHLASGSHSLLWMIALPVGETPQNIAVTIAPWPRNEHSPLVGLKCASYAENLVALDHARRAGFQETLFLNTAGHLCEAATANLFLVKSNILLTPPLESGCLPGIAREVMLDLARCCGIETRTETLLPADLHAADEVFLTSSINGPVSVSQVGEKPYPTPAITPRLREMWHAEIGRITPD